MTSMATISSICASPQDLQAASRPSRALHYVWRADQAADRDFVELYRVMATSLGFGGAYEGHMSMADAMT